MSIMLFEIVSNSNVADRVSLLTWKYFIIYFTQHLVQIEWLHARVHTQYNSQRSRENVHWRIQSDFLLIQNLLR